MATEGTDSLAMLMLLKNKRGEVRKRDRLARASLLLHNLKGNLCNEHGQ